jgi:hypothetical protein
MTADAVGGSTLVHDAIIPDIAPTSHPLADTTW